VRAFVERRIVNEGGRYAEKLYEVPYTVDPNGRPVPDYSAPSYEINLQTLQQNYRAGVEGMLGTGETEAQQTMFSIFNFLSHDNE